MNFFVVHRLPKRVRLRVNKREIAPYSPDSLSHGIASLKGVSSVSVNHRTGSVLIVHNTLESELLQAVASFKLEEVRERSEPLPKSIGWAYIGYQLYRFLQPAKVKWIFTIAGALPLIFKGLSSLLRFKLDISVLDAAALLAALLQKDFKAASTLKMLLTTGEYLEKWARQRSKESLIQAVSLNIGEVWVKRCGSLQLIPYADVEKGDIAAVYAGSLIPIDGKVVSGDAMVNESSLTGEMLAVVKSSGDTVHAGTALEEGEISVEVMGKGVETRFQKIIELIQESESSKAEVETKANAFADRVVPFNFLIALLTFLITRSPVKTSAALSVDYSCAVKLSTPLVFLSAMREALGNGVFFKGGQAVEALSCVDAIVFDKTGTLTKAAPKVEKIAAYNGFTEREVLKIAACLEEHFPHPVAKAVVRCALEQGVQHKEEHSEVKYILAHGIATAYDAKHTVIGSKHFVGEDEAVDLSIAFQAEQEAETSGHSILYLAQTNTLIGVLIISDPIREEAAETIAMLRSLGIKRFYMLTGDNARSARRVSEKLGIDSYKAEMLPNEKADFVKGLKAKGYNVAVVGDGMNDSPALSFAHVGVAMKGCSDIAEQVSDITLKSDSLYTLVIARLTAQKAMERIKKNNISAVGINSVLMFMGITGILSNQSSVWLHNLTTLFISLNSMRDLLAKSEES
ncbi:MAG: heavy metal translocating P-type ATPase [Deferribacteraceae bacterium]|jgi:heavy metal translocating P-type ATPase|nr:heavy metal translocating P-type ATPase [Deferribacteraceae bacterium]